MAHIKTLYGGDSQWDHFDDRAEAEQFLDGLRQQGRRADLHRATLLGGRRNWCVHQTPCRICSAPGCAGDCGDDRDPIVR